MWSSLEFKNGVFFMQVEAFYYRSNLSIDIAV